MSTFREVVEGVIILVGFFILAVAVVGIGVLALQAIGAI